jgi:hypothetical protein
MDGKTLSFLEISVGVAGIPAVARVQVLTLKVPSKAIGD